MKKTIISLMACMALGASSALAQDLNVNISDVHAGKGTLRVAVFNEEGYMSSVVTSALVEARSKNAVVVFKNLKPGTYAVAVIQDEDNDGALNKGMFGIPSEPFGFSNLTSMPMGTPSFEDTSFELKEDTTVKIKMISFF